MLEVTYWVLIALPLVPLLNTWFNLATWRRGDVASNARDPHAHPTMNPSLSILIPARNEERNIQAAVSSALAAVNRKGEKLASEVLVYDDGSTDKTALLVAEIAEQDTRLKLIKGVPLAVGWVGKPHACQRLLEAARGEILLFMDADVRLERDGLSRMLSLMAEPASGRIVSAVPRQEMGSFFERLVMPLLVLTYVAWLPLRLVEVGRNKKTVAANGQLMLMSHDDCLALGGFTAVRSEIVDDVAFCRHAKTSGRRVVFADGTHIARCRMYQSAAEVWRGFSKNLYEGLGENPLVLLAMIALHLACFVAPYVALTLVLFSPAAVMGQLGVAALFGVAFNVVLRLSLALRFGHPAEGILLHPFAVLVLCAVAVNSSIWSLRGNIEWAGRSYAGRARRTKEAK